MLSLAGSLFAEISPAKLVLSWTMLFVLPGLLLGLTPLVASAWISLIKDKIRIAPDRYLADLDARAPGNRRVPWSPIDSADGGKQFLVAELARDRAGLCDMP